MVHFVFAALCIIWAGNPFALISPSAEAITSLNKETKAAFSISYADVTSDYSVNMTSVLPGRFVNIEVKGDAPASLYSITASRGRFEEVGRKMWRWHAPTASGSMASIVITNTQTKESIRLHVFVMVPISALEDEYLNGYRIGYYPERPLLGQAIYRRPVGFIEVTESNQNTSVSPHYRLRDFVSKQPAGFPKYLVLRPQILLKLEHMQERLTERGIRMQRFAIFRGYLTPYYNKRVGNVDLSRHQWGGAADIYIDEDRNGIMDDLNGDGSINVKDAEVLYRFFDQQDRNQTDPFHEGGLATYEAGEDYGPFLHVDVRGTKARW